MSIVHDGLEECSCGVHRFEPVDVVGTAAVEFEIAAVEAASDPVPAVAAGQDSAVASVLTPPESGLPDLDPVVPDVQQAAAAEPTAEPLPQPVPESDSPPAAAAVEPVVEDEENLFVIADAVRAEGANLSDRNARSDAVEPPAADGPSADADGQLPESDADSAAPAEPANPLDAAEHRAGEPARLWVDATGRHAVVGVLVGVREDGTCILDTGSGMVGVSVESLRRRDRDYAEQAGGRLAARERPAATATAAR